VTGADQVGASGGEVDGQGGQLLPVTEQGHRHRGPAARRVELLVEPQVDVDVDALGGDVDRPDVADGQRAGDDVVPGSVQGGEVGVWRQDQAVSSGSAGRGG